MFRRANTRYSRCRSKAGSKCSASRALRALKLCQISGLGTGSGRCAILNVASPVDGAAFRGGWASFFGGWPSLSTPSIHERPASMITDDKAPALEDALRKQPLFATRSLADAADALAGAAGPLLILGLRNAKAAEHTATRPNGSRTLSRANRTVRVLQRTR